jgi:glucose-1-phosphate thymidylyltransferase
MKGIILAGGFGARLNPITLVTNKHLIPIYDKPMICYPIETLVSAGIDEILIVVSGESAGSFIKILKNGEEFGIKNLVYKYQHKINGGIADALSLAKDFAKNDNIAVILGDNTTDANITEHVRAFSALNTGPIPTAKVFLKEVKDPNRFGVATIFNSKIVKITEKPEVAESNLAVTGLYFYDNHVFKFINQCSPSERNELEITDVNNLYIQNGNLLYSELSGYWKDSGTFDSILESSNYYKEKYEKSQNCKNI